MNSYAILDNHSGGQLAIEVEHEHQLDAHGVVPSREESQEDGAARRGGDPDDLCAPADENHLPF
jgi:hypothetical protein